MAIFGAVDTAGISSTILQVLYYTFTGLLGVGIFGGLLYLFLRETKYKDFVIIRSEDKSGNIRITFDKGGVFKTKKTGHSFYRLKRQRKVKIGLNTINYTYSKKGKKIVELFDLGHGNYCSLLPKIKLHTDGLDVDYSVTKADVDWAKDEYLSYQKAFTSNSKLWQLLPYIGIVVMFLGLVIIGIYLIKAYPAMTAGLASAAQHLADAARAQAGVIN